MAIRTKTIEYCFPLHTTELTTGTSRALTQLAALAIPETTSRTFRSVILEVFLTESGTAAASLTAILMGIQLAAVAFSDATVTQTIANSGENQSFLFTRDVTSYFVTNYTGTTMTCNARVTATGVTTINCSAKLIITYEYDDAATTQIKTVKIPIDGNIAALTTAFTTVGTTASQWPNLDTFLPERGKVYRDVFFQIDMHDGTLANTTTQLSMRSDGPTTLGDGDGGLALISDVYYRRIDKLTSLSTNAVHTVEALTGNTNIPWPCLSGHIVVTYEFSNAVPVAWAASTAKSVNDRVFASKASNSPDTVHVCTTAGTTGSSEPTWATALGGTTADGTAVWTVCSVMNSVQIPAFHDGGWAGGIATGDKNRANFVFPIQEPGTVALQHSAVLMSHIDAGAVSLDLRTGSQASRVYVHAATVRTGCMTSQRRVDSGAVGGAGLTIARGWNTLTVDWFTTSAAAGNIGAAMNGLLFLNYTSGLHKDGYGVHAHTAQWIIRGHATGNLVQRLQVNDLTTPIVPETNFYTIGVGYEIVMMPSGTSAANLAFALHGEVQSGEAEGAGFRELFGALYATDAEIGVSLMWAQCNDCFKRWPSDPDTARLDIETDRDYRFDANVSAATFWQAKLLHTYHAITYAWAGSITNSAGGTVPIKGHLAVIAGNIPKGTEFGNTSRVGNGAYSITWFDNTVNINSESRESATLLGRSDDGLAS